ncbi:hypothetical protein KDA_44390 [Dictyobacter alpinus]|uniref:Serine aminopeptidase S33 domain-containing protein n=1 Tax=Dictyobacter alpinus TaxID=2014873 RepID=A0A402BC68_9CHLR|nr:alpha/beta fold hydrolase [Dictyobacter alpinus]GCE28955.1 hypothetical protein KDA_44390 [Dictyobacter alpinus]
MSTSSSELARRVVEQLAQEQFEQVEALLADNLKPFLSAGQMRTTWQTIALQAGDFQQQLAIQTIQTPQAVVEVVTCAFARTQLDINLAFNTAEQIISLTVTPVGSVERQANTTYDAPPYARPEAFQEQEIQVGTGEWALPGTLSLPVGTGPFPAVVLVHGSGPADRDETIPPNKPFRDLAWGLASKGIAVLRYEKRTHVYGDKLVALNAKITVQEETIEDALLALEVLQKRPEIDQQQLYLLGHSLGGYLMPRILSAPAAANVQGAILLAASARPLEDMILEQVSYINSLQDNAPAGQQQLDVLKQQVAQVKDPQLSLETPKSSLPFNTPPSYWLDLRGYQPVEIARHQAQPLLILQADNDYQVTQDDFQLWQNALKDRTNVTFKRYPGLHHLFMPTEQADHKATPASYQIPGHVSAAVIDDIANWITQPKKPS